MINVLNIDNNTDVNYQRAKLENEFVFSADLKMLSEIFQENPSDIFKYKTNNCIVFITNKGIEVPLKEAYEIGYKNLKPAFLKIFNEWTKETDNDLLISTIHHSHEMANNRQWMNSQHYQLLDGEFDTCDELLNLYANENGYNLCLQLKERAAAHKCALSAINYCLKSNFVYGGFNYQGYLPTMKQFNVIKDCHQMIDYLLQWVYTKKIDFGHKVFWTSNELSHDKAACWWNNDKGYIEYGHKSDNMYNVLPLYHKIKGIK